MWLVLLLWALSIAGAFYLGMLAEERRRAKQRQAAADMFVMNSQASAQRRMAVDPTADPHDEPAGRWPTEGGWGHGP